MTIYENGENIELPIESNGARPVNVQDQVTTPIDFFFTQPKGLKTSVAVATSINDYSVEVLDGTNCLVGDYLGMFNADDPRNNRAYFGTILSKSLNVLTLDTPMDHAFKIGDTAACFTRELKVLGSPASPQYFAVEVGSNATQSIDITRLMISMTTDTVPNLIKFGDLTSLTNGIVLRRVNGVLHNIWNVKNNGELANLCFDYDPYVTTNPAQGENGAKFRYTFAGQDKHGVAVRLDPGDRLELIVRDDLTGLLGFRIIAEGHYVTD
jgi:hypothetical protein